MVFQPVHLAAAVHVWRLVCLGGRLAMAAANPLSCRDGGRYWLSLFRSDHDDGRAIPRIWTVAAGVALRDFQSGQDQSSFLSVHPLCRAGAAGGAFPAARLARSHMAALAARNRVRTIFALGVLLRNLFVIRCAFRAGRSIGGTVDARAHERHRYRLDDDACLLPILVEVHRSSPAPMDGAIPRGTAAGASKPTLRQTLRSLLPPGAFAFALARSSRAARVVLNPDGGPRWGVAKRHNRPPSSPGLGL